MHSNIQHYTLATENSFSKINLRYFWGREGETKTVFPFLFKQRLSLANNGVYNTQKKGEHIAPLFNTY